MLKNKFWEAEKSMAVAQNPVAATPRSARVKKSLDESPWVTGDPGSSWGLLRGPLLGVGGLLGGRIEVDVSGGYNERWKGAPVRDTAITTNQLATMTSPYDHFLGLLG
jgi:hypothetical protein